MAETDLLLLFKAPVGDGESPLDLVFGDEDPSEQVVELRAAGRITRLRGVAVVRTLVPATAQGRITGLRGTVPFGIDINVARPTVGQVPGAWQEATAARAVLRSAYEQAAPVLAAVQELGEAAVPISTLLWQTWQQAQRLAHATQAAWQDGQRVARTLRQAYEEATRTRAASRQAWQEAERVCMVSQQQFEEALRRRHAVTQAFSTGVLRGAAVRTDMQDGRAVRIAVLGRYEEAWHPRPGITPPGPKPPIEPPCYVPVVGGPVDLVFVEPWTSSAQLVFVCCKPGPDPEPPRYQIPLLKVYMTVHSMEAVLLPSMEPVALTDVSIASDDDGFAWSLSANGPGHLLEQLAPIGGIPVRIRVVVDGVDFVFVVQSLARTRRFGEHRVALQGVSTSALLGSPYMPEQTWLGNSPATAQQLLIQALEFTGVDLDWTIPDWLVPAGVWSHRGTPLSAVMRVAEAVGAVVRSHRTQDRLIVAPRFPVLPWQWPAAVPDVSMPAAVIATDDLRPEPRAPYNAVYVSGQAGGILGHVLRAGSAGEQLAPQVTDALITDETAARQRGAVVLAGAGNKLIQSITMPLVTGGNAPGLIQPGQLIEVADVGQTWRGLVRATRLSASMPVVRQQITVERAAT